MQPVCFIFPRQIYLYLENSHGIKFRIIQAVQLWYFWYENEISFLRFETCARYKQDANFTFIASADVLALSVVRSSADTKLKFVHFSMKRLLILLIPNHHFHQTTSFQMANKILRNLTMLWVGHDLMFYVRISARLFFINNTNTCNNTSLPVTLGTPA